jgi:hypothetical protein
MVCWKASSDLASSSSAEVGAYRGKGKRNKEKGGSKKP